MSRASLLTIVSATLVAIGAACWLNAREAKRPWPKPTPPPPASDIYHDVKEPMPTVEEIDREIVEHTARIEAKIQAAIDGGDPVRREGAMAFLLPELLQLEPGRVVAMFERQQPGPKRDLLRDEVALIWTNQDLRAATKWMLSLGEHDRQESARIAVDVLTPIEPAQAAILAKALGLELKHPRRDRVTAR